MVDNPRKKLYSQLVSDPKTKEKFEKYSFTSFENKLKFDPDAAADLADLMQEMGKIDYASDFYDLYLPANEAQTPQPAPIQPQQPPAVSLAPPQRQSIEQQAAVRPVEPTQPQAVAPVAPTQTPQQPTNKEIGYVPPAAGMLGKIAANPFVQSAVNTVKGLFSSNTGIEGGKTIKADKSPLAGYEESQTAYRDADKQFRRLEEESKIKGAGSAYGEYDYGTHLKLAKELPTLKAGAEKSLLQAGPVIDKIVEEAYNKADKSKFMEYNPSTKKETVSLAKIQNLSRQIAKQAGLPETGYAQQRLTTQMKAYVEHKQIEPDVEKEVYKLLGNQTPADVSKKDFEGYIKANTKVEGLKKQADMAQNTVANQLSKEAKATASQFEGQYKSLIADLDKRSASDPEIAALQQSIVAENSTIAKQTHEKYQQMVNSGKMTVEQATAARDQEYAALNSPKRIEEQKAQINALAKKKYGPEYANAFQQYVNGLNASNTKFNRRYKREAGEIVDLVNAKINSELETAQKQYKANPQTVEKIKAAYQKAYGKVLKDKDLKEFETDKSLGFWNQLANSTISSFGAGVSGYATTFGLGKVAQLGDVISNNFHPSNVAVSKAGDWLDPIKAAHGTGDLLGRMIPSIAVGAATAAATRGTGAPLAARLMLTGFADMMAESADISGTIYKQVLDKTGSAVDAGNAARDSFEGNLYNYPAYVVGGLPFFANALKGVPGLKGVLGRTFTGAALELGSETFTEAAQGAQEKSIMAGQRLKDTFKELTIQHILDTELQMAPIAILGGAPHLFQGGRDAIEKNFADRAVKAYRAKEVLSTELNDENQAQYFAQLHNEKGAAFAKSMLGSLVIDGKITPEQNERLSSFIDNYDNWSPQAKKLLLNKAGAKVGGILFNDLQQAKASTDPQLIKEAQLAFDNFIKTGKAEMLEVGLTDGSTYYYKPADFSRMLENPEFQKLIQEGSVKLAVMSPDMNTEFLSEKINMVQNAPRIGPNEQAPQQPSETTYETVSPEELQAFQQGQIDPERAAAIADDVALIQSGQKDINSIDDPNYRLMVESAMAPAITQEGAGVDGGDIIPATEETPILPSNEQLPLADQAAQNMGTAVNQPLETGAAAVEVGESGRPVVEVEGDQVVEEEGVEVTPFKKGDGHTLGTFEDKQGKLYKSLQPTEARQNKEGVYERMPIENKQTDEYNILKELQGNPHIPKIGKIVQTSSGPAFEIERLDEVENLSIDEYREVRKILDDLNDKEYHVGDKVTIMRRPKTNELVVVDFSAGYKGNRMSRDTEYLQNVEKLLSKKDQDNITTAQQAISTKLLAETLVEPDNQYYLTQRPPSIGTHPVDGFVSMEEETIDGRKMWKMQYDRPLSKEEIESYELKPVLSPSKYATKLLRHKKFNVVFHVKDINGPIVTLQNYKDGKSTEEQMSTKTLLSKIENGDYEQIDPEEFIDPKSEAPKPKTKTQQITDLRAKEQAEGKAEAPEIIAQIAKPFLNIDRLVAKGFVKYVDSKTGKPCAKFGMRDNAFSRGGKWEIVKDLKGYATHEKGGVDLTIDGKGVRIGGPDSKLYAADGLLMPNDGEPIPPQKKQELAEQERQKFIQYMTHPSYKERLKKEVFSDTFDPSNKRQNEILEEEYARRMKEISNIPISQGKFSEAKGSEIPYAEYFGDESSYNQLPNGRKGELAKKGLPQIIVSEDASHNEINVNPNLYSQVIGHELGHSSHSGTVGGRAYYNKGVPVPSEGMVERTLQTHSNSPLMEQKSAVKDLMSPDWSMASKKQKERIIELATQKIGPEKVKQIIDAQAKMNAEYFALKKEKGEKYAQEHGPNWYNDEFMGIQNNYIMDHLDQNATEVATRMIGLRKLAADKFGHDMNEDFDIKKYKDQLQEYFKKNNMIDEYKQLNKTLELSDDQINEMMKYIAKNNSSNGEVYG